MAFPSRYAPPLADVLVICGVSSFEEDSDEQDYEDDHDNQSNQDCQHHVDEHKDESVEFDPESSISELQEALGPLLLARRQKCTCITEHPKRPFVPSHGCADTLPFREPIKPTWTGAFNLFSFPLELRERIYFHYLTDQRSYIWSRFHKWSWYWYVPRPPSDASITDLFLTSRQVYTEAFAVFCRYNTVFLNGHPRDIYGKRLDDVLRHFPLRPSRALQCVGVQYLTTSTWGNDNGAPDSFLQVLRDAHELRSQFPRLRIFKVRYEVEQRSDAEPLLIDAKWSEEQKIAKLQDWMRSVIQGSNVVPPPWVKWELLGLWREIGPCDEWGREIVGAERVGESPMNKAYRMLVREFSGQGEGEDLEESGRKWIEETSRGKRRRRRRMLT